MRFTPAMIFYELADHSVHEVIDFYATRGEAEATFEQVLEDEPGWAGMLEVVAVEFRGASENQRLDVKSKAARCTGKSKKGVVKEANAGLGADLPGRPPFRDSD
jgi:hypothetical protein